MTPIEVEIVSPAVPLPVFEIACLVVVVLTLVAMTRGRPAAPILADYAALAVAGYLGEQSCIAAYHWYAYAPGWHARLVDVPILVPLIWPLVILSARDVASSLFPNAGAPHRALLAFTVVVVDASLVEVVAVRAGLWSWAEPGHLGVPIIGIVGWGYFAAGAELSLGLATPWRRALLVIGAPVFTHALLLGSWWGLFRWGARRDLGATSMLGVLAASVLVSLAVLSQRRRGHAIPLAVAMPRVGAAGLFFVLLATTAPRDASLWLHTAAVAIPYLLATRFRTSRSAAAPA